MRTKSLPIPLHHQATRPRMRATAGTVASHIGRHCGTGIWPARDIPSVDLMLAGRCASLPTAPPAPARTPAENRGFLTSGGEFRREADCLLERDGFEPSVPPQDGYFGGTRRLSRREPIDEVSEPSLSRAVPEVRIHLPPAEGPFLS